MKSTFSCSLAYVSLLITYSTSFYYQHDPSRLSTCPLTIHALLHIADSIVAAGPVWASWAFPMERYCGFIQPAFKSRRFPFACINRFVLDHARLTHIRVLYDAADILQLRSEDLEGYRGAVCLRECESIPRFYYLGTDTII